ncbi:MAG: tRNA (adenosine(37)-N6)-dimethylallyltransferase MiaA [Clostridia bacterium]|nr:tRNA (adenosine(37)-N6)-dimethylallyltransferase MiaA [Clostridia bacterium]
MKPKVVVIVGPTASGKTALSIELAKKLDGEIISSDSMQIYKDMDIGTAKVTKEEAQGIKHYLVDFVSPDQRYTVSDFKKDAETAIKEILEKGKVPIVVGGTGLYVNSLIYGIEYQDMKIDENYRNMLMERAEDPQELEKLWEEANRIDPEAMTKISRNDKKRIIRVLEIYKATGKTKTEQEILSRQKGTEYDYKVFGISMDREKLYERINLRVDLMIQAGLEDEVKNLLNKYSEFPTAMQGLGYKEVKEYFDGIITREEMIDKIKQESRRYAKRQLTWFRRNNEIIWLDKDDGMEKNLKTIIKEL